MKTKSRPKRKPSKQKKGETIVLAEKPRGIRRVHTEKEYEKQQQMLLALEDVSKTLTVEVDLQKILEDMATVVGKAVNAKWVNFWELTTDKKSVYISAAYGMQSQYIQQSRDHPIALGKAWIGRAVKTGKAWGTNDILKDPRLASDLASSWKGAVEKQDYHALLCMPTISRQGPVGGMCVYYPDPHEFTDFEMRLVTVAANQAATAITNAQIFGELTAERNKTVAMLNSLSDGLIMYDLEGNITVFNPRAEELLWIQRNAVLNQQPAKLSTQKNPWFQNLKAISALLLGEYDTREITLTDPQRMTLTVTNVPVRDPQSQKIGSMRVLHDITKEKEAEELKSSFVSIASHQLRTPLSGIKWSLATLGSHDLGPLSEEQSALIKKTSEATDHLVSLVNDLLDVSRIEEGRFGYEFRKINIRALVEEVLKDFETVTKAKKPVSISIDQPKKEVPLINADKKKLKIAISNVIDNAIKYTPKGSISITLYPTSSTLLLAVEDMGIGIPTDQQGLIFTKFFRGRNAIKLQTEGSGLGLWIANEIVKKHNGRILFESKENKGSTFTLQLPISKELMPRGRIKGL